MDITEENVKTTEAIIESVDAILAAKGNQRALMSRLAMTLFNRFGGATLRAFTQFPHKDLAAVITAKAKGVFDYGVCIRDTDHGPTFPKNAKAVMTAIDLAADGKYNDIDLESLGLQDGEGKPLVAMSALCPNAAVKADPKNARKGTMTKKKPEPVPTSEDPVVLEAEEIATAVDKAEEKEERPPVVTPPRQREEEKQLQPTPVHDVIKPVMDRIDKLSTDLADALEEHLDQVRKIDSKRASVVEDEIGYVKDEIENVKSGIIGLFGAIETIDRNMRQILLYFVDPLMEFEDMPEDLEVLMTRSVPIPDGTEEKVAAEVKAEKSTNQHIVHDGSDEDCEECQDISEAEGETEPDPPVEEESKGNDAEDEDAPEIEAYTKEELEAMDLDDLRNYAQQLGVSPARWRQTNVNRVLAEYKRRGIDV